MNKQELKSAMRRTEKLTPKSSITDILDVTVISQEDWDSLVKQADNIPDLSEENIVWVRKSDGSLVGTILEEGETRGDD